MNVVETLGLGGLGLVELGVVAAVGVLGLYVAFTALMAWLKRILLRMTIHHFGAAAVGAVGLETVRRFLPEGSLGGLLEAVVGVVA